MSFFDCKHKLHHFGVLPPSQDIRVISFGHRNLGVSSVSGVGSKVNFTINRNDSNMLGHPKKNKSLISWDGGNTIISKTIVQF